MRLLSRFLYFSVTFQIYQRRVKVVREGDKYERADLVCGVTDDSSSANKKLRGQQQQQQRTHARVQSEALLESWWYSR